MAERLHPWRMTCASVLMLLGTHQAMGGTTAPTDRALADQYVAALVVNDLTRQAELLAENAVFEDPMGTTQGKEAIHEIWQAQKIRIQGFKRTAEYPSGRGTFVFTGMVSFEQVFKTTDGNEVTLQFALDCTIAITLQNGKVVRHVDYVDTEGFMTQLDAQVAELRSSEQKTSEDKK